MIRLKGKNKLKYYFTCIEKSKIPETQCYSFNDDHGLAVVCLPRMIGIQSTDIKK